MEIWLGVESEDVNGEDSDLTYDYVSILLCNIPVDYVQSGGCQTILHLHFQLAVDWHWIGRNNSTL